MEFNFNSICRTCMGEVPDLHSIYEKETIKKLKVCCDVQVWENDGLPAKICQLCLTEVEQAFTFRERVKRSDISLRQILRSTKTVVKAEPNEVMEVEYLEFEGGFQDADQFSDAEEKSSPEESKENAVLANVKCELDEYQTQFKCTECGQCFRDKRTLVRHGYVHMPKQFKCTQCDKSYNRPDKLTAHMRTHTNYECSAEEEARKTVPGAPYECEKCGETFKAKRSLRTHFYDSKCAMQFECQTCHKVFANRKNYFRHRATHETPEFACNLCDNKFMRSYELKRHLKEHGVNVKSEETESEADSSDEDWNKEGSGRGRPSARYQCESCKVNFASEKYYRLHLDNNKCGNEPYTCQVCHTVFSGKKALRRHSYTHTAERYDCDLCDRDFVRPDLLVYHKKRDHNVVTDAAQLAHDTTLDPNEFGVYQCQVCSAVLKDRRNLKRHYQMHSDIKFKCTLCNKEYNRRYEMNKHMRQMHGQEGPAPKIIKKEKEPKQEIYKCEHPGCNKEFTKRYKYKEHLAVHSDVRPFLCGQCGQAFKNKQTFLNHEIRHGDVKPFKCEECSKGYYTKKDLAVHLRSHTGEKPYVCTECGASYTRSDSLANHWKKHTGERPHACEFCPKRFIKGEKLKIHRRIHTGERPYACWICDQRFTQKYDMVKHARRHQEYHAPPNTTVVLN
ncbi:zinc finger protein 260-like [Culicoides brevitarsis]|uniref:zinc finger protein 260-like n=1 Tax=Culicoides brevitarsis TaxID=469753 RepID=UPI00307BD1E3